MTRDEITDCGDICYDDAEWKNGSGKNLVRLQLLRYVRITNSDTRGHAKITAAATITG